MAKKRSSSRFLIIFIFVAAAASIWIYFHRGTAAIPVFTTAAVTKGELSQVVTASGSLEPVTSIEIGSQVSGLITEVLVDFNSPVKANQLIAKIDPATYEQRLRQAEADLASTQANHRLVQLNTERTRELRKQNLVSQQELDQAEATLSQADAAMLTKESSVENAKVDLSRCSIYAPVDGIVLDRKVEVGKTVAASLNSPVLFVIADDLSKMQINAAIAESDIGAIEVGQNVNFNVDAFPTRQFRGRVVQIRNTPTTESNVVTYQTIIQVNNESLKLKPGMTANVSVIVAHRSDTLLIPNSALRVRMPESLLPATEQTATADGKSATGSAESTRDQMRQLMKDAGFTPGSGPPSPEVRARMAALAKERGIELPASTRGEHAENAVTTRKIYLLGGTPEKPQVKVITVKLGISDGINTELIEGAAEGDSLITSVFLPAGEEPSTSPSNNPFSGARRRL